MEIYREDKSVHFKIVYHGPALCGKTTNLQSIFAHTHPSQKLSQSIMEIPTQEDKTLTYDIMPLTTSQAIRGYTPVFSFYTVPGQVHYKNTRRLILEGADCIVFVADSQKNLRGENIRILAEMKKHLRELREEGKIKEPELVVQFNKRDLSGIMSVEMMVSDLIEDDEPYFEASAVQGAGVPETMQTAVTRTITNVFPPR